MNTIRQIMGDTGNAHGAVQLLLTGGHVELKVRDPQEVMEEIWLRATQVGSVLEGILHDPHTESHQEWSG